MTGPTTYLVTLETAQGRAELAVPTFQGPEAAARRAFWTACAQGWGDVDEVQVIGVEPTEVAT